jgi:hypothetical protein
LKLRQWIAIFGIILSFVGGTILMLNSHLIKAELSEDKILYFDSDNNQEVSLSIPVKKGHHYVISYRNRGALSAEITYNLGFTPLYSNQAQTVTKNREYAIIDLYEFTPIESETLYISIDSDPLRVYYLTIYQDASSSLVDFYEQEYFILVIMLGMLVSVLLWFIPLFKFNYY